MPTFNRETKLDANTSSLINSDRRLLLFDLEVTGHHPGYIQHLIKYWCDRDLPGYLDVVVSPKFLQMHADIVKIASECGQNKVNFVAISAEEDAKVHFKSSAFDRAMRAFQEWKLLCKYASFLKSTHCTILYFDSLQFPLFLGAKPPCSLSGIYFRPVFHYSSFGNFKPSWREKFWQIRDKIFLSRILRHSHLQTLYCLDPFVVEHLEQFNGIVKAIHLADPVEIYNYPDAHVKKIKESLGIEPNRTVFLMFGALRKRKGIYQLLDAIALLSSELCEKFCLLLVGPVSSDPLIQKRIKEISESLPIQIVKYDKFVPDQEIQPYFQIADVILAPYQRHIGMSAILVRAAAAQKPVLSSNYGLMGQMIKHYQLGMAVDTTIPNEITKGLMQFLQESPKEFGDSSQMKSFAERNTAQKFANVILE